MFAYVLNPALLRKQLFEASMQLTAYLNILSLQTEIKTVICLRRHERPLLALMTASKLWEIYFPARPHN